MSVVTGSVRLTSNIVDSLAAGATRTATLAVPMGLDVSTSYTDGVTTGKFNRTYYLSSSAVATPTIINLSTIVCTDLTVGMTHVRVIIIANDDTVDTHTLIYGAGTTPFSPDLGGTTPTETIQPGTAKMVVSKPLGALGHAVSTNINVKIDPGANTVPFRIWIYGSTTP